MWKNKNLYKYWRVKLSSSSKEGKKKTINDHKK